MPPVLFYCLLTDLKSKVSKVLYCILQQVSLADWIVQVNGCNRKVDITAGVWYNDGMIEGDV